MALATGIVKCRLVFSASNLAGGGLLFPSFCTCAPSGESSVISNVVSILVHRRSRSRWTYLRAFLSSAADHLNPNQFSQIVLGLKARPHVALHFYLFTVRYSLCTHNPYSYSAIIHILSRARLKTSARAVIRDAIESPALLDHGNAPAALFEMLLKTYREFDSAPFVFDLLIKSSLEAKMIDSSLEIVNMLRSSGIHPQIGTYNYLIEWISKCNGSCEGYRVFRSIFESNDVVTEAEINAHKRVRPNVCIFNTLMTGFFRNRDVEMVEKMWVEMRECGCNPNSHSYSVYIAMLCEKRRMREVEDLWEEMKANGINSDIAIYNTVIGAFCSTGEIKKARDLFREMHLRGMKIPPSAFEQTIKGYCIAEDIDSAVHAYDDVLRKNIVPCSSTMELLIAKLCENKRALKALNIMMAAMEDLQFCPSEMNFELIIVALCEDGKMEEALEIQEKMALRGFKSTSKIYDSFIHGYLKLGNTKMAEILKKEMCLNSETYEEDDHTTKL